MHCLIKNKNKYNEIRRIVQIRPSHCPRQVIIKRNLNIGTIISDIKDIESANIVEDINAALELKNKNSFEHKRKILNELENPVFWKAENQ
jgi:uncharacterized protein YpiB (UPF0302 family)